MTHNKGDPVPLFTIQKKTKEPDRLNADLIIWIDIRLFTHSRMKFGNV
jgi:hypothetical protein